VTSSYDNSTAVVVLPPVRGRLHDNTLHRWLSRSILHAGQRPLEPLAAVLGVLGMMCPGEGHAALRMWGQTGDRPTAWIAAADPVFLEAGLQRVYLHPVQPETLPVAELRLLFEYLQQTLAAGTGCGFARLGHCGYLRAQSPMVTARVPANHVAGRSPEAFMPAGDEAGAYLKMVSEIEMALHDHPVNVERQLQGQPPVNSLWLWGGGHAPAPSSLAVPPLFADDPLLRGYWHSVAGSAGPWPGSIEACLEAAAAGFVAALPEAADAALEDNLRQLRAALASGRLNRLQLLFADGVEATLRRGDRFRVWRGRGSELDGDS